jgi:hypothetical protein
MPIIHIEWSFLDGYLSFLVVFSFSLPFNHLVVSLWYIHPVYPFFKKG